MWFSISLAKIVFIALYGYSLNTQQQYLYTSVRQFDNSSTSSLTESGIEESTHYSSMGTHTGTSKLTLCLLVLTQHHTVGRQVEVGG